MIGNRIIQRVSGEAYRYTKNVLTKRLSSSTTNASKFQIRGSFVESGCVPELGRYCEVSHTFSHEEVVQFASLCGDTNPIHTDKAYAEKSIFKGTIVHGILVSSLFSTLFGRTVSGAVYVTQSLNFKRPVPVGAEIIARIEIIKMETRKKGILLTCCTTCRLADDEETNLVIDGEARVLLT